MKKEQNDKIMSVEHKKKHPRKVSKATSKFLEVPRDLSWLDFNYRVLQEAKDESVPLFERIKFIAIFSSNLDEFFRVRIAEIRRLADIGKKTQKKLDFDPKTLLKLLLQTIKSHQAEMIEILNTKLFPALKKNKIVVKRRLDLSEEQKEFIENYFKDNMLPFVQPVLLVKNKVRPFLTNGSLYLSIWMKDKGQPKGEDSFALIKLPSDHLPRFISLPNSQPDVHDIIFLDDIVRQSASWLFPGFEILDTYSIKLSRDADLFIDDEYSGDLIEKIKKGLTKRNVGEASRFVYDNKMPSHQLNFLLNVLEISKEDCIAEGRYHNNKDFFQFPTFDMEALKNVNLPELRGFYRGERNLFELIAEKDRFLHFPFHSYDAIIDFFEQAAIDPLVTHIKVVQYRVAKSSKIMDALIEAVENGKHVSVFIEVKARFDEEANLKWGERLHKAGVEVHYSFPGVKVHSKLALVRRLENGKPKLYSYLSTGNFNEDTAKIYSDIGIFTAHVALNQEVERVFSFLETVKLPSANFKHLLVGKFNLREDLTSMILDEIKHVEKGGEGRIILKMNSLQDLEMIKLLYKASRAGVKIQLIIRGICCLVPGIKGLSENIEAISIVDRYLEHSRIFIFHNNGKPKVYLSSADFMTRNLSFRIETAFPVLDEDIKNHILQIVDIQLNDNVKARNLNRKKINEYKKENREMYSIRSQVETYFYLKRLEEVK